jgi:hypothetical protein
MTGTAVGKVMNLGYPGNISRGVDAIVENHFLRSTDVANINFGDPVVLNSDNTVSAFGSAGTAATFLGIAVREVKQNTDYFNAQGYYQPGQPTDVAVRGSLTIKVNVGTPTANGNVYVRITANGAIPNGVVGGFEATADGTNTVLLSNVKFKTGKIDANKVAEVTIITRNLA